MKQFMLFGIFSLLVLSGFASETHAAVAYNSYCVDFTRCSTGTDNTSCNPIGDDEVHTSSIWGHRVQLPLATTYSANEQIYIVECIHNSGADIDGDGTADRVCTTGNSTLDKELFCGDPNAASPSCDRLSVLQDTISYDLDYNQAAGDGYGVFHLKDGVYTRMGPPTVVQTNASGQPATATIEWQSHTPPSQTAERSYVIFEPVPEVNITPTPTGAVGGQQQDTIGFPPPGNTNAAGCDTDSWDPEGRVFDSISLEPITGAAMTIEQKRPDGVFDASYAVQNNLLLSTPPFITGAGGKFSFFVVNGEYHLRTTGAGYTHITQADVSGLNPLARQMYSDFYLSDSPAILEEGTLVHVDIPLKPDDGIGKQYPLHIFSEEYESPKEGKQIYSGEVSHPFATLNMEVCSDATGATVCKPPITFDQTQGGPDNNGEFEVELDLTILQPGEYFQRSFEKASTQNETQSKSFFEKLMSRLFGVVHAQDSATGLAKPVAKIQPTYTYLEGHAYDLEGNLLPDATVQLFTALFEVPVFATQADEQGYFRIPSNNIPKELYTVQYVSKEGVEIPITTSQYALQNQEFIAAEGVNLFNTAVGSADPRSNVTPAFQPAQKISAILVTPQPTQVVPTIPAASESEPDGKSNKSLYLVGAILLLLLGGAGALIALHMYRKRTADSSEDPSSMG